MDRDASSRITIDPAVRSGQPVIRGTRMSVADILSLLASGAPKEEILSDFPWLTSEDIQAALEYAAEELRGNIPSRDVIMTEPGV